MRDSIPKDLIILAPPKASFMWWAVSFSVLAVVLAICLVLSRKGRKVKNKTTPISKVIKVIGKEIVKATVRYIASEVSKRIRFVALRIIEAPLDASLIIILSR